MSPNKIYAEAKDEMNSGSYEKAVPLLEKLEGRAAGTPLAQQAQLDKAYAHYKSSEPAQAIATLERFMKLHPASPAVDYALYLKGIVKELVTRFPDSRYSPDARQRMTYIVNSLAEYEVHVARFYFKRGAYLAAINRAQLAVSDYRDVPATEEALFIMVKSYDELGMAQMRDDSRRVLEKNFPQSEFLSRGFKSSSDPWWKFW